MKIFNLIWAHLQYLSYVLRHKWFVYREGRKLGVGRWQLLVHDLSKFRPDEWFPYVYTFYIKPAKKKEVGYFHDPGKDLAFDTAWLKHQHRNPHHWQHWMLTQDSEPFKFIPMPEKFWREMVADWKGAGLAQGHDDLMPWYTKNRDNIKLHRETRARVETLIGYEHDSVEVVFTATEEEYEQFLERHNLNRHECVRLWGVLDHLLIGERLVSRVTMSGDARQAPALDDKHTEQLLSERHRLYWEKKQRESK